MGCTLGVLRTGPPKVRTWGRAGCGAGVKPPAPPAPPLPPPPAPVVVPEPWSAPWPQAVRVAAQRTAATGKGRREGIEGAPRESRADVIGFRRRATGSRA